MKRAFCTWHFRGKIEMPRVLWLGILVERDHLEDAGVDGIIILK